MRYPPRRPRTPNTKEKQMGRPIQKKNFGNTNSPYAGGFTGLGGEGVAAVVISNSGTNFSQGTVGAFSAPDIAGGVQALGTLEIVGTGADRGKIMSVTITEPGTGYTAAPTFTLTTATAVSVTGAGTSTQLTVYLTTAGISTGMKITGTGISASATFVTSVGTGIITVDNPHAATVSGTMTLVDAGTGFAKTITATSAKQDAILFTSFLTTGSSAVTGGDIMKQVGSRRYKVRNSEGVGVVKLTTGTNGAGTLSAGQMSVVGTDHGGSTYYFEKINQHTGRVFTRTSTSTAVYSDGQLAKWTLGVATGTTVTISNTI
jgi:hypothetical protein